MEFLKSSLCNLELLHSKMLISLKVAIEAVGGKDKRENKLNEFVTEK